MPAARAIAIPVLAFGGLLAALVYHQQRGTPLKVSGFVEAHQIRVGSRVGGRVLRVAVEEGQRVQRGALLVELEPFDLLAEKARTLAERDAAQQEHARLVRGYRPEEIAQAKARRDQLAAALEQLVNGPRKEEIATAQARVRQAEAQLELARVEHARTKTLFADGQVSESELDRRTRTLRDAEATLDVQQQELALLLAGTRPEAIAAARAQLAEAAAALELAERGYREEAVAEAKARLDARAADLARVETRIAELSVAAPVDGIVEAVDIRPGDLVSANAPVLSVLDDAQLWVRAYVPENHLDIEPGRRVEVTVDSYADRVFAGEVTFVSSDAEFTPGNVQTPEERSKQVFRIKVMLRETLRELRPGMAADVWLEPRR